MRFGNRSGSVSRLRPAIRSDRLRTGAAGMLVAAGVLSADPASAFELFGWTIFGSDEEAEPVSPDAQRYTIDVTVAGGDEDLESRVKASSLLFSEREETPPPSTAAFLSRVRAETGRIVGGLYAEGRYGGSVEILVDGRDPETIAPDATLPQPVPVTIRVDPGPAFAFGDVEIRGRAPQPPPPGDEVEETPDTLGLVVGALAKSSVVLASEKALVEEWREQGHPKAAIDSRDAVANHPTSTLDVAITVEPGPPADYGTVSVSGTDRMDPEFVAWMTGIEPGRPFDPDDIEKATKNLRRLQVFSSTRIVEADAIGPDGRLPLEVQVAERLPRVFGVGATYSTIDGAGVEGYWEHRNLFGRAERLRLEGRVGGVDGVDVEEFEYYTGITFTKPGVLTPLTDLTAALTAERNALDAYTDETVRARVGLAHEFFEGVKGTVAANLEYAHVVTTVGGVDDSREFLLASIPATLDWDARSDPLDPTGGFRLQASLEPFYEVQYGNPGVIAELEGSTYLSLDDDGRFVLAARAAVGSILGPDREEIPASRLFFAGGGGSIRGYAFRNVGPRENGDVVGGRSYVEGSLELRARITDTIGIVPFVDAGSAFASSAPDFSEEIKIGAGIGLRYHTGLGPIRVDAAVPLNPEDDDPSFGIYIGLGQAF